MDAEINEEKKQKLKQDLEMHQRKAEKGYDTLK